MHIPCRGTTIGLDSPKGEIPFLSHAHADHTSGLKRKKRLISTPETLELAGINAEVVKQDGARLLEAGHMLGARQLAVEGDGGRIVYSGDICLESNIFGFKAEIPQCDRLIMEATYGDPAYDFPPLEDVHRQIERWVSENESSNLVIGCYHLGKAQEMIKILNECSLVPVVTEKTEGYCSIYEKYGIRLERIVVGSDEAEEAMSRRFVAVVPMNKAKRYFAARLAEAFGRETLCAVATGWALHYRFNTDAAFPLSDHADFDDLVHYAKQSGAKDIEFFCGDGRRVLEAVRSV
jgi:putative mRNA 3-end processing factor